ncbi:MAG TPA: serine hydrolase domain-containing protein [Bryobacteraceae bacterium]|nr:serine hydrolase domain-containing protein [Bryobacteraceae bacterium]
MLRREFLSGAAALALRRGNISGAVALIEAATRSGAVSAAALHVRQGSSEVSRAFGQASSPETPFLLASITKPMTATAVMILADRRALALSDPVRKFIPEFTGGDRDSVTVKHLLTHTSGLPDMLPENEALRKRHAPLQDFAAAACRTPLLFKPGTECRYQSMGILLAGDIVERITRTRLRDFLRQEVFQPLGMTQSSLGLGGRPIRSTALCQVAGNDDWNWNSPYWRDLGAPWGGAHATAPDVARFLRAFLLPPSTILTPQTAAAMIVDQNAGLNQPWGLGWSVKPGAFGKGSSPRTFGHNGSTGTIAWADPKNGLSCVLLTTRPGAEDKEKLLRTVSDKVSGA